MDGLERRLRLVGQHAWRASKEALSEFLRDHCTQMAAAISYGLLFAIFPLAILVVSIAGLVIRDPARQERLTDWLLDNLPLSSEAGFDLERAVSGVAGGSWIAALVAVVGLLWAASGVMGTVRTALGNAWSIEERRSFVRGKLFDFGLVLAAGVLLLASFGVTIVVRVVRTASAEVADSLDGFSGLVFAAGALTEVVLPLLLTFVVFALLYRLVPERRPAWRDVAVGAGVAAVGAEALKTGFAFYLAFFANYNVVYGSLAAVIGFLFLVYLTALVFLFGAELAAAWPKTGAAGAPD